MVIAKRSYPLTARQTEILTVLAAAPRPLSTSMVRRAVNHNRRDPLVIEQVYRTLCALHNRGYLSRVTRGDTTEICWQLIPAAVDDTTQSHAVDLPADPEDLNHRNPRGASQ